MATKAKGYWRRLWDALWGLTATAVVEPLRDQPRGAPAPPAVTPGAAAPSDQQLAETRTQVAGLRLDVQERDLRIAAMQREYAVLQAAKEDAVAQAGHDQLEQLFHRLVGPWSNLAALTAMVEAGQEVAPADLTVLVRSLEKELTRAGLTAIGQVGAQTVFDVACHQRMSGGTVQAGTPVTVQIPGYHFGSKVLMKALVSAPADGRESQEPNDDESGT